MLTSMVWRILVCFVKRRTMEVCITDIDFCTEFPREGSASPWARSNNRVSKKRVARATQDFFERGYPSRVLSWTGYQTCPSPSSNGNKHIVSVTTSLVYMKTHAAYRSRPCARCGGRDEKNISPARGSLPCVRVTGLAERDTYNFASQDIHSLHGRRMLEMCSCRYTRESIPLIRRPHFGMNGGRLGIARPFLEGVPLFLFDGTRDITHSAPGI